MDLLLITHFSNALLMVLLPIGLGIFLTRRFALGWRLWWIGAATFIVSQVAHIPFNQVALNGLAIRALAPSSSDVLLRLAAAVALGLSAGVFEEGARYIMYRWAARDARSWRKGLLAGAGHGGIEALILGGLTLLAFFQLTAVRGVDLSTVVPAQNLAAAQEQVAAYWSAPWYAALLGVVERVFALTMHVALSVIVLQVFTRGRIYWLLLAIGWHALVDAASVYAVQILGPYLTELLIGLLALASLGIIFALKRPEPPQLPAEIPAEPGQPPAETGPVMPEVEVTANSLEKSRYL